LICSARNLSEDKEKFLDLEKVLAEIFFSSYGRMEEDRKWLGGGIIN